jgi:hypothetical protein
MEALCDKLHGPGIQRRQPGLGPLLTLLSRE